MIKPIFKKGRHTYGARRIKMILARENVIASRRRIVRLMQEANLICKTKRKFKATTDSKHNKLITPNLLDRKFNVDRANCYWVGDITYIPTEPQLDVSTTIGLRNLLFFMDGFLGLKA